MTDNNVTSLEAVRTEPQKEVIDILREMLVMAREGTLRGVSMQGRVVNGKGDISIHETWGGDMTYEEAVSQIRQHEFNLRIRTWSDSYASHDYDENPPLDESELEGQKEAKSEEENDDRTC